jgi:DNA-binding PadR family transcriptional regulator
MGYSTKALSTLSSRDFLKMCTLSYIIEKGDSAYGREIMSHIKSKKSVWTPSHGSLYPLLNDMVSDKVLYIDEEEGKRKYYKLTRKGKEYYKKASSDFVDTLKQTSKFYESLAGEIVVLDNKPKKENEEE